MSNEDNFIIKQLSDMILKLHSSRNDIESNSKLIIVIFYVIQY